MQHLGINFGGTIFGGLNLVSLSVFWGFFCFRNLGWFLKV